MAKNDCLGMLEYATMLWDGKGGPKDPDQARSLVSEVAKKGTGANTHFALGNIFMDGTIGVGVDRKTAANHFWLGVEADFGTVGDPAHALAEMFDYVDRPFHERKESDLPFDAARAMQFYLIGQRGGLDSHGAQEKLLKLRFS